MVLKLCKRPSCVGASGHSKQASIGNQHHRLAVACGADLRLFRWHIHEGNPAFEKRWSDGYVLVPANGAIHSGEVPCRFPAVDHWLRPVDSQAPLEINLRHRQTGTVSHPWMPGLILMEQLPPNRGCFSMCAETRRGLFLGWLPKKNEAQTMARNT